MIVTRFAPSPTGYLHLGHAYAALQAFEAGERFLLRIEDIDPSRCRPQFIDGIYEDLGWLGLAWPEPVLLQSTRSAAYRKALDRLSQLNVLYPCFCTRKDIAAEIARAGGAPHGDEGPLYPGICRGLSVSERAAAIAKGTSFALRLDSALAARLTGPLSFTEQGHGETGRIPVDPLLLGDVVLARKEMPAAYHLAVVVDDAFQGVTLVTRGLDLFAATHVQRLLQVLLALPEPAYAHHQLILDAQGRKFSKRDNAVTLRAMREAGLSARDVRSRLPPTLGSDAAMRTTSSPPCSRVPPARNHRP